MGIPAFKLLAMSLQILLYFYSFVCLFVFSSPFVYFLWRMGRYAKRIAADVLLAVALNLQCELSSLGDVPQPMAWSTTATQTEISGAIVDACDICGGNVIHHAHCPFLYGVYADGPCELCGSPEHPEQFCPMLEYTAEMDDSDEEPLHEENRRNRGLVFDFNDWGD
jgi:hypothetical protein